MTQTYSNRWLPQKYKLTTYLVAISIFVASIFLSFELSKHVAMLREIQRLERITAEMKARLVETRKQFSEVVDKFSNDKTLETCSKKQIEKMQEYDVARIFLQAIGHVNGNVIECSTYFGTFDGLDLGSPIKVEKDGTRVWVNVEIKDWNGRHFVFYERLGWAALIDPQHAIVALGDPAVSVGIFGVMSHTIFTARGKIYNDWLTKYKNEKPQNFIDTGNQMLVYIMPAELRRSALIAAIPLEDIKKNTNELAKLFIPIGALIGLVFSTTFIVIARNRFSSKNAILKGLMHEEFFMEYQPIIHLETRKCVGAEALIRWRSHEGKTIMPDLFIPLAESNGLISEITARVFKLVAQDMKSVFQEYPDIQISINISSQDLLSESLLKLIDEFKEVSGAKSNQIALEATERGFVNDEQSVQIMKRIRNQGVKIAIDDFGTGYSSLSYLTKFELDYIKIDKSFVDSVGTEAVTRHVAFHIIEMAKSLSLGMIAEGVETDIQAKLLFEKGVKLIQGWLFSKALSSCNFIEYLQKDAGGDAQNILN